MLLFLLFRIVDNRLFDIPVLPGRPSVCDDRVAILPDLSEIATKLKRNSGILRCQQLWVRVQPDSRESL
jgi:hypothetical protein